MRDAQYVISLVDDGPGVTPAQFDRLTTALASQNYERGLGLGLMLADLVARAHHGSVRLLELTRGFGVEFSLPLLPPKLRQNLQAPEMPVPPSR